MTAQLDYNKYYMDRIACIRQAIRINEEFLGKIDDWESYTNYLDQRDNVISEMEDLDKSYGARAISNCTKEQINQMDHGLNLVLALDKDIAEAIDKERTKTLASMKTASINKKITAYGLGESISNGGRLLDRKE